MIKEALQRPKTFKELQAILCHSHTKESLIIELDFLIEIGAVELKNNEYFYKKKQNKV